MILNAVRAMHAVGLAIRENGVLIAPLLGYAGVSELAVSNAGVCFIFSDGARLCYDGCINCSGLGDCMQRARGIVTAVYSILKAYKDAGYGTEAFDALAVYGLSEDAGVYNASLRLARYLFNGKSVKYPIGGDISPAVEEALLKSAVHAVVKLGRSTVKANYATISAIVEHDGFVVNAGFMDPVISWNERGREYTVRLLRLWTMMVPDAFRVPGPGDEYAFMRSILGSVAEAFNSAVAYAYESGCECYYPADVAPIVTSYAVENGALTHGEVCAVLLEYRLRLMSMLIADAYRFP